MTCSQNNVCHFGSELLLPDTRRKCKSTDLFPPAIKLFPDEAFEMAPYFCFTVQISIRCISQCFCQPADGTLRSPLGVLLHAVGRGFQRVVCDSSETVYSAVEQ